VGLNSRPGEKVKLTNHMDVAEVFALEGRANGQVAIKNYMGNYLAKRGDRFEWVNAPNINESWTIEFAPGQNTGGFGQVNAGFNQQQMNMGFNQGNSMGNSTGFNQANSMGSTGSGHGHHGNHGHHGKHGHQNTDWDWQNPAVNTDSWAQQNQNTNNPFGGFQGGYKQ